ncbi:MAG TPA: class I SAM-dependent methyltransferase, partial [Bacteroidales bacterium]|nr:class I SAM-dependent methyltransferase [Bacteroidales bacterium]
KLNRLYTVDSKLVSRRLTNADTKRLTQCKLKIEKLWAGETSSYLGCKICSFEFSDPFIAADAELYSLIYHSEAYYPVDKWEYKVSHESIERYIKTLKQPVNLIEIGAGNGSFLKRLVNRQPLLSGIYATEYSEAGAKAIESLGISCFRKDFIDINEKDINGKLNIVCMFQVLEHMTSVHDLFKHLNKLTAPGAHLYISVPNNNQRRFFDRFGYFYDLPPVHVGRYNPKCMAELSIPYGWRMIHHEIQPTNYNERIKKFLFGQFARWQNTFASEKLNLKILKLFLRYCIYLFIIAINIRVISGLLKPNLGTAQWFELERIN